MSCILWLNMDFQWKIQNHFQILCPFFDILNPKEYPQSYNADYSPHQNLQVKQAMNALNFHSPTALQYAVFI